jgi:hypothetical protein
MTFRQDSAFPGRSDWQLACAAFELHRSANRSDDPQAEADRRMEEAFTADEAARIDAFMEAAQHDTGRLAAIEARLDGTTDDTAWLTGQLRRAWALMDELRDRIDNAGSTMHTSYVESAIAYVRWSRKTA